MSFWQHTPEALLSRNDSRNPATTCKGLTSSGRPCRRALAANATSSARPHLNSDAGGVVAILDEGGAAAYFCWQHKDQARALLTELNSRTKVLPLKQKSSIDTLVERIGVLELEDEVGREPIRNISYEQGISRNRKDSQTGYRLQPRDTLPQEWRRMQGPLMSVPEEVTIVHGAPETQHSSRPRHEYQPRRSRPSKPKSSWSCCTLAQDEDRGPAPRRREYKHEGRQSQNRTSETLRNRERRSMHETRTHRQPRSSRSSPAYNASTYTHLQQPQPSQEVKYPQLAPLEGATISTPTRPSLQATTSTSPPNSQTAALLSRIPDHLSPSTTSALLLELSKPISPADEQGYIYIFWLTPESDESKPDDETASSILDGDDLTPTPSPSRPVTKSGRHRRRSELDRHHRAHNLTTQALQRFASIRHNSTEPKKILLKIGRAGNVHRRLSQWTKQCGQNITLIRYYPYVSQSREWSPQHSPSGGQASSTRQMVPHVHRVERLIHLELADQRVANKGKCEQCGREHKEWFEVEATRGGVRAVDEVIRRWVGWAESANI